MALAAIVSDPQLYAVELPEVSNTDPLLVIALPGAFDVAVVAEALDISPSLIYQFNPALQRAQWSATAPLRLILPTAKGKDNGLASANRRLLEVPEDQRIAWREISVRRGDTISEIAAQHGLSSQRLKSLNLLSSDLLQIGQTLRIPASTQRETLSQSGVRAYTVQQGDSLWRIAQRADTSVSALVKLNKVGPRELLRIGQILQVPEANSLRTAAVRAPSQVRKIRYRVRRGDSLSRIAQRFRLKVSDIAAWNNLPTERYLQPGQGLTLYVDIVGG
ncbi:MAG: LysM peptidoglycan-binding domain-containing protein [Proteobacteria bacterium]|nr:LysM peptidoglycan-binding domain-containing protein [Pseudomonadota bacterium]